MPRFLIMVMLLLLIIGTVASVQVPLTMWASSNNDDEENNDNDEENNNTPDTSNLQDPPSSGDVSNLFLDLNYTRGFGVLCVDDVCQGFVVPTDPRGAFDRSFIFPAASSS